MRTRICTSLLALALSIVAAAPAAAVFYCGMCDTPSDDRCFGDCNGQLARTCDEWFALGCRGDFAVLPAQSRTADEVGELSEEQFVRSLREETAEPAGCESPLPDRAVAGNGQMGV